MEDPTNSSIRIESTSEGFAWFDATLSDPSKQACIKEIQFEVLLPPTSVKRLKKLQSNAETAANNAAFNHATAAFFRRLAAWEPRSPSGGIKLTLTTRSLNRGLIRELVASGELDQVHNEFGPPIWDIRDSYRYIQFTQDAPPLPKFDVERKYDFHPSVLLALGSALDRLERLERLEWRLYLPGRRLASDRRAIRSALAHALQHADLPQTLAAFDISLSNQDPGNEHFDPGSFGENADDADDPSLAVRRICQLPMIRTLHLFDHWILAPVALAEEEEPAAFDSDDSDTSDYAPEFEWDKQGGDVPGVWWFWYMQGRGH
ncbi:hypothetical protein PG993_005455 [Apiospora rasikravindrae]|uniref:Uncharacterized protein n=1 Tax=Apiospora rasikravindrae TaxID=990691 RepID=A0ABR1TFM1_9PEZI